MTLFLYGRKGLVQKYSDYMYSCNSSWISWSINYFVTKPIKWSFNKFVKGSLNWAYSWVSGGSEEDYNLNLFGRKHVQLPDEEYVVIDLVKVCWLIYTKPGFYYP